MNNQEILDNAPDGASETDDTGRYWIYKGDGDYLLWDGREWIENWSPLHTRSLADIRTIVEQAEENQALKERIAELEQELHCTTQIMRSNSARISLMYQICCSLIDGKELCGFDWDYISEEECKNIRKLLNKRDLEQQAKGAGDFEKLFSFYDSEKDCELVYSEDAISYYAKLRKQAAKIKEQK